MPIGDATPTPDAVPTEPPLPLRREMAVVAASLGVRQETVTLHVDGSARISFVLQTETPVETLATGILPEEPVTFVYEVVDTVGVVAPLVLSGRETFPRNLGHLNPVLPGYPVSFCLARAGLQPVYDRYGIEGVMMRLRTWMRDAMTGGLMADGWEPVPLAAKMPVRAGLLDAGAFQELAARRRAEGGWAAGIARISAPEDGDQVFVVAGELSATQPAHWSALAKTIKAESVDGRQMSVPWIFIWPSDEKQISEPVFGLWTTYKDMRDALMTVDLTARLEDAAGSVLANGCDCKHAPGCRTLVVLIGLWRPVPLADNIFGLSTDPAARRLEIKACTLETAITGNPLADDTRLHAVISNPLPGPALYRWTTGSAALGPAGLIGNGALGSAIADHLLRSGIEEISGIDLDNMMPHNLARHTAEMADVYRPKINHLARSARSLAVNGLRPHIRAFQEDAARLSTAALADRFGGSKLIIDATADERIRGRLTAFNKHDGRQIVRIEIYNRGLLGVQFVTGSSGNPSLLDLYYLLCREALTDDAVAQWLYDEHVGGAGSDELLFGFGCASPTTRLPNYVVAQHASAFMPTIVQGLTGWVSPGIGLNHLDQAFRPYGWRWLDAPEFLHAEPRIAPEWAVRTHPDVLAFLSAERAKALPIETGGYLYGGWDAALKQIIIVAASNLPPRSTASKTKLTLGLAGNTSIERRIARLTRGRLQLCGSWHSHPDASTALSPKDQATMANFRRLDRPRGTPTLFVVVADGGIDAHLEA
jgi:hypothetical protein